MKMRSKLRGLILTLVFAGVLLLASCSTPSSPPSAEPSTAVPSGPAATPTPSKPTGSLIVAPNILSGVFVDPSGKGVYAGTGYQILGSAVFESLIMLDVKGQPSPGVAERWEIAKDGLSQTFYIRKGIKFHDGSDLTGADVKFTIDTMVAGAANRGATAWRNKVTGVELKDDYIVVIRTKPTFELLDGLEAERGEGAVLPQKYIEKNGWEVWTRSLIGSGPWKVAKFEQGARIELEANENHWREVPKFQKVTFLMLPEEATKVAMLKTGELDIADVSPDSAPGLKAAGLRILGHYGASQFYAALFHDLDNPQKHAFGDIKVRKAMSLAIDRKEIADKLYGGYAQPSAAFYVPLTAYFYDANVLKPDPMDVDQAKRLLAEAGYANGFKTTIWDSGGGGIMTNVNQAMAGFWRKVGINAEATPRDYPSVSNMFIPKQVPDIWGTVMGYATAGNIFHFKSVLTAAIPPWVPSRTTRTPS